MTIGLHRTDHRDTAVAAAQTAPVRSGQATVLAAIRAAGEAGLTDQQIQDVTGLDPNTERPRRVELLRKDAIWPCGKRKTRSNRWATTWATNPACELCHGTGTMMGSACEQCGGDGNG